MGSWFVIPGLARVYPSIFLLQISVGQPQVPGIILGTGGYSNGARQIPFLLSQGL